jgi:DNA-binding protein HU-beta
MPSKSSRKPVAPVRAAKKARKQVYTKLEFVSKLAEELGVKDQYVRAVLDAFFEMMVTTVGKGRFRWNPYGVFDLKTRKGRLVKHPTTGEPIRLPNTKRIVFRNSKVLKARLNPT